MNESGHMDDWCFFDLLARGLAFGWLCSMQVAFAAFVADRAYGSSI